MKQLFRLFVLFLVLIAGAAFADANGTMLSARIAPSMPVQNSSVSGICNASSLAARVTALEYMWHKNGVVDISGEMLYADSISAGKYHTCAIRAADSRVFCWGQNDYGQLGDGTNISRYNPAPINDTAAYSLIAAGYTHTCAIRSNDSQVLCWGSNSYGELGDGTAIQHSNPAPINDTSAYSSLATGMSSYHTCAIRAADSRVFCWGPNAAGQLGDGTSISRYNPVPINDTAAYSHITAGASHTCGIRQNDSRVFCWGQNDYGQLGDGTNISEYSPSPVNDSAQYSSISAGGVHTCGILKDSFQILCWGQNNYGQLGDSTHTQRLNPTPVNSTASYFSVMSSYFHTCAIRQNDSQVLCWGKNNAGQLGDGTNSDHYAPAPTSDTAGYAYVTAGFTHSCGIRKNDSRVLCWGENTNGQLGNGRIGTTRSVPTDISVAVSSVSAGTYYTCIIRQNDSRVLCSGYDSGGQLGNATTQFGYVYLFAPISDTSAYRSISAGTTRTCGIRQNDSHVLCWGSEFGTSPVEINDSSAYSVISTGDSHTCGIRANDSRVLCWGQNDNGQLGVGDTASHLTPTLINDTSPYLAISAGYTHTCGIRANDSRVLCWGMNTKGELGDNTSIYHRSPATTYDDGAYAEISAGYRYTCGIIANDSRVRCWGQNDYGQLGNAGASKIPKYTDDAAPYSSISTTIYIGFKTCGIRQNDSRVLCWGSGSFSALGNNATATKLSPTLTADTAGYSAISSGAIHACGIRANDSELFCWGDHAYGELGLGNTLSPLPVVDNAAYLVPFSLATNYNFSIASLLSKGQSWLFSCRAISSAGNSSWTNASAIINFEVLGNASNISSAGLANLSVEVNNASNFSGVGFGSNATVEIADSGLPVLSFNYNFTAADLDLSQVNLTNGSAGGKAYASAAGINSSDVVGTKTIYIYNADPVYTMVCIKDAENASSSQISSTCTDTDEYLVTCNSTLQYEKYNCTLLGTTLTISGLNHSAVMQYSAPAPPAPATGGGTPSQPATLASSFDCAGGNLNITVTSSGSPRAGIRVSLTETGNAVNRLFATTDPNGIANFTITETGGYSADIVSGAYYGTLPSTSYVLCGQSAPPPALPQPAASGQNATNQTRAPIPPANASENPAAAPESNQTPPAASTPSQPTGTMEKAASQLPVPPEAQQKVAQAAPPAISLAIIGAAVLLVLAAIAGYLLFIRKKKQP